MVWSKGLVPPHEQFLPKKFPSALASALGNWLAGEGLSPLRGENEHGDPCVAMTFERQP